VNETDLLRAAAALLADAGIPDPQREVRRLRRANPDADPDVFLAMAAQRARRVPMAHILGYRDFYHHRFIVTSDVLDPRPDTEALVAAALEAPFTRVLDLGTGSGCILLSLIAARAQTSGTGTDISDAALEVARHNAARLALTNRAALIRSDWFAAVEGTFDLIVSNPPYIAAEEMDTLQPEVRLHEPRIALTDEADGLSAYRRITAGAPDHLASGGRLMVEIGPTQAQAVSWMMLDAGLQQIRVITDLDGRNRVVAGRKP